MSVIKGMEDDSNSEQTFHELLGEHNFQACNFLWLER